MIDFTSLFIIAGVLFGLLAGDAALYGDTLRVQIAVPQSVSNAGFTEVSAEAVFMAEAAKIVRGESIIPAPTLRVNASPSVITALARPLNLDSVVAAMQSQLGIDHLLVTAAILAEASTAKTPPATAVRPLTPGTKLDMIVVVVQPHQTPVQTVLEQEDGDATLLVRRGAAWAMEQVSPYRVLLAHFLRSLSGDHTELTRVRDVAARYLARPWDPDHASEIAMTHNVLALLAMMDNNLPEAESQLTMTKPIPGVLPAARLEIALNHAFLAVAQKQSAEAAALLRAGLATPARIDLPGFSDHLAIMQGLVAWSGGDLAGAENQFRQVIADSPNNDSAHHYLQQLLLAKGDRQGAAEQEAEFRASRAFDDKSQGLAVVLFWTDPVNGGIVKRP